jgi:hypothetical protein
MRRAYLFAPILIASSAARRRCRAESTRHSRRGSAAGACRWQMTCRQAGLVKFAVIGDTGTGDKHQLAVAKQLTTTRAQFPVRLRRDDGRQHLRRQLAKDYDKKFAAPTSRCSMRRQVLRGARQSRRPERAFYKPFNMNGERYYSFKPRRRAVLRARQQLHGPEAAGLARRPAGGERIGLEDLLLPSPARIRRGRRMDPTTSAHARADLS